MGREVRFGATAADDLTGIYDWIYARAGSRTAQDYVERIVATCRKLGDFPDRGTPRNEIWAGLRTIPFRKSATIAYFVEGDIVRVVRVVHRGRELSVEEDDL